jgi:hypothetical protein
MPVEIRPMDDTDFEQLLEEERRLQPPPIRHDTREALIRWASRGIEPGGFLMAVLTNDLKEAMGRADAYNRASLFSIVSFCYNELPSPCWGSPDKVKVWANQFYNAIYAPEEM